MERLNLVSDFQPSVELTEFLKNLPTDGTESNQDEMQDFIDATRLLILGDGILDNLKLLSSFLKNKRLI
jgi:hypothetical protein